MNNKEIYLRRYKAVASTLDVENHDRQFITWLGKSLEFSFKKIAFVVKHHGITETSNLGCFSAYFIHLSAKTFSSFLVKRRTYYFTLLSDRCL